MTVAWPNADAKRLLEFDLIKTARWLTPALVEIKNAISIYANDILPPTDEQWPIVPDINTRAPRFAELQRLWKIESRFAP